MARPPILDPIAWRSVWLLAMFDLPVETRKQRRDYTRFRTALLDDGFVMMQYSVYMRHCASPENATVHRERMTGQVPPHGEVRFLTITDAQFARIVVVAGKLRKEPEKAPAQLEFF